MRQQTNQPFELANVAAANTSGNTYNSVPAGVLEREKKQRDSLDLVKTVVNNIGDRLPIINSETGTFSDEPGFYLIDSKITAKGKIADAEFDFDKRLLSRAADSAHAVIAGEMSLTHADGMHSNLRIAAKPYMKRDEKERMRRAQQELSVMHHMWDSGEVGVRPIAVAVVESSIGKKPIIFTKYDPNLTTMDNQPWGEGPTERNVKNATQAAKALARFNMMGYKHGDAKIKNVASRVGMGKLGMIDFETTTNINPNNPDDVEGTVRMDFDFLLTSLSDEGMFDFYRDAHYRNNSDQIIAALRDICQNGYLSCWEGAPLDVQSRVVETAALVADRVAKDALRKIQTPFSI